MADWFLGIDRGKDDQPYLVTTGTSTTSKDIELRIDSGKATTRKDVVKAMEVFEQFILSNGLAGANLPPN